MKLQEWRAGQGPRKPLGLDRRDAKGRAKQEKTKAWLVSKTRAGQVGAAWTLETEECTSPGPDIRHPAGGTLQRCHPLRRGF